MRRQHTLFALAMSAIFFEAGNVKMSNAYENSSRNSMGHSPIFGPTRSQRVKNKIRSRQKNS